jgi:hypothetical protein
MTQTLHLKLYFAFSKSFLLEATCNNNLILQQQSFKTPRPKSHSHLSMNRHAPSPLLPSRSAPQFHRIPIHLSCQTRHHALSPLLSKKATTPPSLSKKQNSPDPDPDPNLHAPNNPSTNPPRIQIFLSFPVPKLTPAILHGSGRSPNDDLTCCAYIVFAAES